MKMRSLLFGAGLLIASTIYAQAQQASAPAAQPSPAMVEEGKKLFTSYGCYQCHGYEG
jgi:cytochrome c551/c552